MFEIIKHTVQHQILCTASRSAGVNWILLSFCNFRKLF